MSNINPNDVARLYQARQQGEFHERLGQMYEESGHDISTIHAAHAALRLAGDGEPCEWGTPETTAPIAHPYCPGCSMPLD